VPDRVRAMPDRVRATPDRVRATPDRVRAVPDRVRAVPDRVRATFDRVRAMPLPRSDARPFHPPVPGLAGSSVRSPPAAHDEGHGAGLHWRDTP
jgi:hypothetical protein